MTDEHPAFFAHQEGDAVAVAVRDLEPGPVVGGYLSSDATEEVELAHAVPLGHKVAVTSPGTTASSSTAFRSASPAWTSRAATTCTPTT